jgi:uncharacterized membrane protein YciS (DUF1049 family)
VLAGKKQSMRRIKLFLALGLLLVVGAIVMQNLEPITINLIVGVLEMPLAALLVSTLLVGYVLGLLTTALWKVRSWRSQALAARRHASDVSQPSAASTGPVDALGGNQRNSI